MKAEDVIIKQTEALRVAEARGMAAGLAPEYIGRVFRELGPKLIGHLQQAGAQPGMLIHYYDRPAKDGTVGVHVAYEIEDQTVPPGDGITISELPVIEVASVVYRGAIEQIPRAYEDLMRWIRESEFQLAGQSRELYREMGSEGPRVTEIQIPIVS